MRSSSAEPIAARSHVRRWLALLSSVMLIGGICWSVSAQDGRSSAKEDSKQENVAQPESIAQMKAMQRRAASLKVWKGTDKTTVELSGAALLRYSSPGAGTTDGSLWAWGKAGRPVALGAVFFEQRPKQDEKWSCELLSLTNGPVGAQSTAGWKWAAEASDLRFSPIPDAPAVAEKDTDRARQMKELARRFAVSATYREGMTEQLRLMVRALHRYSDREDGLLDGVIHAFASGTNPEALLLLEARSVEGGPDASRRMAWHFGFARMGAGKCQAKLDDRVVWDCPAIKMWNNREPYFSTYGPSADVFGEVSVAANE
jgi:hypothetical protein